MRGYRTQLASSVGERDGMQLELISPAGDYVAEVFEDPATGRGPSMVSTTAVLWESGCRSRFSAGSSTRRTGAFHARVKPDAMTTRRNCGTGIGECEGS